MTGVDRSGLGSTILRGAASVGLLVGLAWLLDFGVLIDRLAQVQASWVVLAMMISVLQIAVSAWRWRFTAGWLGIPLPFSEALREYYLASFLNQLLPGGVAGDVSRAWRHHRSQRLEGAAGGPAARAVVLERASGQGVMTAVAVLSLLLLPTLSAPSRLGMVAIAVTILAVLLGVFAVGRRRLDSSDGLAGMLWREARTALLSRSALPAQMAGSLLVVGSYVATYLVAARAVGVDTTVITLLPLVAPVLVTMLIPVTIAGWGIREGAAAALWGAVGLTPVDGVAISVTYGLLVLLSTLPGAVVLGLVLRRADRSRRQRSSRSNRISRPRGK